MAESSEQVETLNIRVARDVFNLDCIYVEDTVRVFPRGQIPAFPAPCPVLANYVGVMADAWKIVEHMAKLGFTLELRNDFGVGCWLARFETADRERYGETFADAPSHAISLAALAAVASSAVTA